VREIRSTVAGSRNTDEKEDEDTDFLKTITGFSENEWLTSMISFQDVPVPERP